MDVLERISTLRRERNWSEYELAQKAGMTQSTISSWYKKKLTPSIPSLEKICAAFGLSMSEFFFAEEKETVLSLTERQVRLLNYAAHLSDHQYDALITFIQQL